MSKNTEGLSSDVSLARKYVRVLSLMEDVKAVNVGGSRSIKSAKSAREDSDWDFHVIMANPRSLPQPRQWGLHGETHAFLSSRKNDVQVWPDDEFGILNG